MPTKSDRILSYLPGTFKRQPPKSALFAIVDAFGRELLDAENSLAAIMQAHWVDHADRGAEVIDDLARIAALYGLAPRGAANGSPKLCDLPLGDEETVEEFREHLKRYIRTFLEGTVTVQGILRVTAEALGLRIADAYAEMDTWWDRENDALITEHTRGDDAAARLFGFAAAESSGSPATPAQITGTVNLSVGVDLSKTPILRLKVDDNGPVDIDLWAGNAEPMADLDWIVNTINQKMGDEQIATHNGRYLTLSATDIGPSSSLEVYDGPQDAAPHILGLAPRVYSGREAFAARVTGTVDLSNGVDLRTNHYLRLAIDRTRIYEIALPATAGATLAQIMAVINDAAGEAIASEDNGYLTLSSPTAGFNSSIGFEQPAAQDATTLLFGDTDSFHLGQDAQPARVTGSPDLSGGVDLREKDSILVSMDGDTARPVNCAGANPANTRPGEIAAAINAVFGPNVAQHDGRRVTLASNTTGPAGNIAFETPDEDDATELIFGIGPRAYTGRAATAAHLAGTIDLSVEAARTNLMAQNRLLLSLDGGSPFLVDVRAAAENPAAATLNEIVQAINETVGYQVAGHDNQYLSLTSPTAGGASRLEIHPYTESVTRRFVTRAMIIDEAAQAVLGFVNRQAEGVPATAARVVGKKDLSRGVDLRETPFLRLSVDNGPFVDIDCTGPRPRATLLEEIVHKINAQVNQDVATDNGRNLILISPTTGSDSHLTFAPPQATDALKELLDVSPGTIRGRSATGVFLTGTVDLSAGIDLEAGAKLLIGIDGNEPVPIVLTEEAAQRTLNQIANAINFTLGENVASHNGSQLIIALSPQGVARRLALEPAGEQDVTEQLFGFAPPRVYQGEAPAPAQVVGTKDLSGTIDLSTTRFLKLGVDGETPEPIDCAALAENVSAVTLGQIVEAINSQLSSAPAGQQGSFLTLTSPTTGTTSSISLEIHTAGDAREILFGERPENLDGEAPSPAIITGEVDLLTPVDLSERSLLRLAVNNQRPVEIDIAGAAPATTFLDEIVTAINDAIPGLASATDDDRLQLAAPATGNSSHLAVQPLRYLELREYPPRPDKTEAEQLLHGQMMIVVNKGAADTFVEIAIQNDRGVTWPGLVNKAQNWQVRLLVTLAPGEKARLWRGPQGGLKALAIPANGGEPWTIPGTKIMAGPLGTQAFIPFTGRWQLTGNHTQAASLQLNNPHTSTLVILQARHFRETGPTIQVAVQESSLESIVLPDVSGGTEIRLVGRIRLQENSWYLVDGEGTILVRLRAGGGADLASFPECVVAVTGLFHPTEDPPVLVVKTVACLYDVTFYGDQGNGNLITEFYPGVTIGVSAGREDALIRQVNAGEQPSQLVLAEYWPKETVLRLPRGRSEWLFLDCLSARFNEVDFNAAYFAGGHCNEPGIFNVSRFAQPDSPEKVTAVFGKREPDSGRPTQVQLAWNTHQPGAFEVNLPADLPPRFGSRFNQARFAQSPGTVEQYTQAVTEPPGDEKFLVDLITHNQNSLVKARVVPLVPLGWSAVEMPFRRAQYLTLGNADQPARLYLGEEGLQGFIQIEAREPGVWGNEIAVSARPAGPASYDVCVVYAGGRFENARKVAAGKPADPLSQEMTKAGSIGVYQAKAAGVLATVTRSKR